MRSRLAASILAAIGTLTSVACGAFGTQVDEPVVPPADGSPGGDSGGAETASDGAVALADALPLDAASAVDAAGCTIELPVPTADSFFCGAATCTARTQVCCRAPASALTCTSSAVTCDADFKVRCDGSEDCLGGAVCCFTGPTTGTCPARLVGQKLQASCVATCGAEDAQTCSASSPCPTAKTCVPFEVPQSGGRLIGICL